MSSKKVCNFLPNADFAGSCRLFRKVCMCLPPNVLQTNWNIPAASVSQTVSIPADTVQFGIYTPTIFKIGDRWGCRPLHRACKKAILLSKMTECFLHSQRKFWSQNGNYLFGCTQSLKLLWIVFGLPRLQLEAGHLASERDSEGVLFWLMNPATPASHALNVSPRISQPPVHPTSFIAVYCPCCKNTVLLCMK
jgi:hypothetical protein